LTRTAHLPPPASADDDEIASSTATTIAPNAFFIVSSSSCARHAPEVVIGTNEGQPECWLEHIEGGCDVWRPSLGEGFSACVESGAAPGRVAEPVYPLAPSFRADTEGQSIV
jgi:hypothetical protein